MSTNDEIEQSRDPESRPSIAVSVSRPVWRRLERWAERARERNPSVYSPSNIVNVLMIEFLKQVTDDPDLKNLDAATEKAAAETARRKN